MKWTLGIALCVVLASCVCQADTVVIGSLNLEDFGYGGGDCKDDAEMRTLAEAISTTDIVTLQEVMRLSGGGKTCYGCTAATCHVDALIREVEIVSGSNWDYICGPNHKYGSRYEFYVIAYNTETVQFLSHSGDLDQYGVSFSVRPPLFGYFRSGNFDFYLLNYHAPSDGSSVSTSGELEKLGRAFDAMQAATPSENDIIVAGDVNLFVSTLSASRSASTMIRVPDGTTTKGGSSLDAIYFDGTYTSCEYDATAGVLPQTFQSGASDHGLVWAGFRTDQADDD